MSRKHSLRDAVTGPKFEDSRGSVYEYRTEAFRDSEQCKSAKTKRGWREADGKENVTTICDPPSPSRNGPLARTTMGSDIVHAAPSSLASTCGVCTLESARPT